MNPAYNYVTVDSANVPLICQAEHGDTTFGQFLPYTTHDDEVLSGQIRTRDMFLPNFSVRAFQGTMPRDTVFFDHHGKGIAMLGSCIFLQGQIETFVPGKKERMVSQNRTQNFKWDPHNEFRHRCQAETDLNFLHISYKPDFFSQFLPDNEPWADMLRQKIEKKERIAGEFYAPITLAQEQALASIFNSPLTGKLGYMMIETSIIQVILLQMYSLFHREAGFKAPAFSQRDLDLANELQAHLSKSFLDDHSIHGLARHFGTNTNKLMNVFKKVFGKSIFEYISEQRMQHARRLLSEEGYMVTEVARTVGYKNPNHFSAAFKRKFGVNPSVFR